MQSFLVSRGIPGPSQEGSLATLLRISSHCLVLCCDCKFAETTPFVSCCGRRCAVPQSLCSLLCRTASLSQHTRDEHQCLHQSVVLHWPLPHTFHGQHTKEVRSGFALLTLMWEVLVSLKALVYSLLSMVTTSTGLLCINLGIQFHSIVWGELPKAVH